MIFKVKPASNSLIDKIVKNEVRKLRKFYGFKVISFVPKVFVVDDRKTIDLIKGRKTESWLVGWVAFDSIFLLNPKCYKTESSHKHSVEMFSATVRHELSHVFFGMLSGFKAVPGWLFEGTAIFTSGQLKFKKKPLKFKNFLGFSRKFNRKIYKESGFAVELLVKKFGKKKLVKLIKCLKSISGEKQFKKAFQTIYGIKLNYKIFNKLFAETNH